MLNESELKELEVLPKSLQIKLFSVFDLFSKVKKSHKLDTYLTLYKQKKAWQKEIDDNPFLIRGSETEIEVSEEGELKQTNLKEVLKEAMTARANVETAMKVIKLLPDLDEQLEKIYIAMTVDEKESVERAKAGEAESILDLHLKSKKIGGKK